MNLPKLVARTRSAEIQAIAIYEAEIFWIREESRRLVLQAILVEERAHDESLADFASPSVVTRRASQLAGWMLGTTLAALPWLWMCRIQAWAEDEAARIYETAARSAESHSPELVTTLLHAASQERAHAETFRKIVSSRKNAMH